MSQWPEMLNYEVRGAHLTYALELNSTRLVIAS